MGYVYREMASPIGILTLVASEGGLAGILFANKDRNRSSFGKMQEDAKNPVLVETERQLRAYFEGTRTTFSLKLDPKGTKFQSDVWRALLEIPYGETRSYGELAKQLGNPKAMRAVGAANGQNPIPIVVPCHRVIGSNGKLTGFGGGLEVKALLLELESKQKRFVAFAAKA